MMTRAYKSFSDKLFGFQCDLELIDIVRKAILDGALTDSTSRHVLKYLDSNQHQCLAGRKNRDTSRSLILSNLQQNTYSSYVKDVYEEVTLYLRKILAIYFRKDINHKRLIGEHSFSTDAKTLLALGNWDAVCNYVSSTVLQKMENERSSIELLRKMKQKLELDVDDSIIDAAIPYLKTRHFLVHSDGVLDNEFIQEHPFIPHTSKRTLKIDATFIADLRNKTILLIRSYDEQIIAKNIFSEDDTCPQHY